MCPSFPGFMNCHPCRVGLFGLQLSLSHLCSCKSLLTNTLVHNSAKLIGSLSWTLIVSLLRPVVDSLCGVDKICSHLLGTVSHNPFFLLSDMEPKLSTLEPHSQPKYLSVFIYSFAYVSSRIQIFHCIWTLHTTLVPSTWQGHVECFRMSGLSGAL